MGSVGDDSYGEFDILACAGCEPVNKRHAPNCPVGSLTATLVWCEGDDGKCGKTATAMVETADDGFANYCNKHIVAGAKTLSIGDDTQTDAQESTH